MLWWKIQCFLRDPRKGTYQKDKKIKNTKMMILLRPLDKKRFVWEYFNLYPSLRCAV